MARRRRWLAPTLRLCLLTPQLPLGVPHLVLILAASHRGKGASVLSIYDAFFKFKVHCSSRCGHENSGDHPMAMSSTSAVTPTGSKGLNTATQPSYLSHPQSGSNFTPDSVSHRRGGGSGSFGAGSTSKQSSAARNNQSQRKQHKPSKRSRFADEDAMAESVRIYPLGVKTNILTISECRQVYQQPKGANLYHASHELLPPTQTPISPQPCFKSSIRSTKPNMGSWFRIPCCRQGTIRSCKLQIHCQPQGGLSCAGR
jgi:hypothetical protein